MVPDKAFAMLLAAMLATVSVLSLLGSDPGGGYLKPFASKTQLQGFLERSQEMGSFYFALGGSTTFLGGQGDALTRGASEPDYSRTNVQVEGVDEPDRVKTDGHRLYLATHRGVVVVEARPATAMAAVTEISMETLLPEGVSGSFSVHGLFLEEGHLIVILSRGSWGGAVHLTSGLEVEPVRPLTFATVLDVSRPEAPQRLHTQGISGSYQTARLTQGHLYLLATEGVRTGDGIVSLPLVCREATCREMDLRRVLHDPDTVGASSFSNLLAMDLRARTVGYLSLLTGYASTLYMSSLHLYVSFHRPGSLAGRDTMSRASAVSDGQTTLYKVATEGIRLRVVAAGTVPGRLLNQFSLDEWEGHLRVATTTEEKGWANHLYVLDGDLEVVGALEGLAPGERIYSARFLGDRAYLVTFKKVDPFFVLDVADPRKPRVLGDLKIPGFSEYMHPVGDNLILGIGKDTVEAEEGDFAWFQGIKVSLFDVRDVTRPVEAAKLVLGDRGSDSPVLRDHRAFLPIPRRGLAVLPLDLAHQEGSPWPSTPGRIVWRGAYVLQVGPGTLEVAGSVTHWTAADPWPPYNPSVLRSLYIGNALYTISEGQVKATSLEDLSPLGSLVYSSLDAEKG